MRTSWFPRLGAALLAGALVHLSGCNASESLVSSSRDAAVSAAASAATSQTLLFRESALDVGERARDWRASSGVELGRFATKKHKGISFRAPSGSQVWARTAALPGTFDRASKAKVRLSVRNASPDHPVTVRFDFNDAAGVPRWSQSVTFEDGRWKTVTLRLPRTQHVVQALLSPLHGVSSWGMTFEDDADVRVQNFELWRRGIPAAPSLGLAVLDLATGEPPALRAGRSLSRAWSRGDALEAESVVDGIVSLHRQMAARFPATPNLEEETPITRSAIGGVQSVWRIAKAVLDRPDKKPTAHPFRPEAHRSVEHVGDLEESFEGAERGTKRQ